VAILILIRPYPSAGGVCTQLVSTLLLLFFFFSTFSSSPLFFLFFFSFSSSPFHVKGDREKVAQLKKGEKREEKQSTMFCAPLLKGLKCM